MFVGAANVGQLDPVGRRERLDRVLRVDRRTRWFVELAGRRPMEFLMQKFLVPLQTIGFD